MKFSVLAFQSIYAVDIAVACLFLIFTLVCAKKGAIKCVLGLVATVGSIVVALLFASKMEWYCNEWFGWTDKLGAKIGKGLEKWKGFNVDASTEGLKETLKAVKLPTFFEKFLVDKFGKDVAQGTTLGTVVGTGLAQVIMKFAIGLALFILVKIVLKLVGKLLTNLAKKSTTVSSVNSILGALIGLVEAAVIVYGVLAVASLIPTQGVVDFFHRTKFVRYLYDDNLLMKLLMK